MLQCVCKTFTGVELCIHAILNSVWNEENVLLVRKIEQRAVRNRYFSQGLMKLINRTKLRGIFVAPNQDHYLTVPPRFVPSCMSVFLS